MASKKKLKSQVKQAEEKAARWKDRAKSLETETRKASKQLRKLTKKLSAGTSTAAEAVGDAIAEAGAEVVLDSPEGSVEQAATPDLAEVGISAGGPDETWTLAALRAEAKERGVTGYSRKSKAELLALLS
ncbi:hypothetical protein [Nocardioides sp. Kera G14]|uniref:hypothetical protein n=1 Tax=Nocardioides sp. Kera G14 TaxID=2884264 RepID=UPI001D101927|nr:hypothetical protein [Nocardioides sp. Kera G14]UDY24945.1 hypothetical protein LH076_06540 [Nocardioides sp. Kera G14]